MEVEPERKEEQHAALRRNIADLKLFFKAEGKGVCFYIGSIKGHTKGLKCSL